MAKPIKETPSLRGKDAKVFVAKMNQNKNDKASREEYEKVMANYRKLSLKA
jgi:hypothetical protein